ncbi:unnamed protein product, partial [Mesorhabditis belari]|uniref:Uncharacterized protein n=1 Tax=Mesorhabditis belari TaxID=2138241 RepID=A0AAF3J5P6_9BILA
MIVKGLFLATLLLVSVYAEEAEVSTEAPKEEVSTSAVVRAKRQCGCSGCSSCGSQQTQCVPVCVQQCQQACGCQQCQCSNQCQSSCQQQCGIAIAIPAQQSCNQCQSSCSNSCGSNTICLQTCQQNSCPQCCPQNNCQQSQPIIVVQQPQQQQCQSPCCNSCQSACQSQCATPVCVQGCQSACNSQCSSSQQPIVIVVPNNNQCSSSCSNSCQQQCPTPVCVQTCQSQCNNVSDHRPPTTTAELLSKYMPKSVYEFMHKLTNRSPMSTDLRSNLSTNLPTSATNCDSMHIVGIIVLVLVRLPGLRRILLPGLSVSHHRQQQALLKNQLNTILSSNLTISPMQLPMS